MNPDPTATEPQQPKLQFKAHAYVGTEQQVYKLMAKAFTLRITPFIIECLDERNNVWQFSVPTEYAETVNVWFPL